MEIDQKSNEDERYYVPCPNRKNQARVALTICERCEFASHPVFTIEDPCWFPASARPRKKKRTRPAVKRVERDGLS